MELSTLFAILWLGAAIPSPYLIVLGHSLRNHLEREEPVIWRALGRPRAWADVEWAGWHDVQARSKAQERFMCWILRGGPGSRHPETNALVMRVRRLSIFGLVMGCLGIGVWILALFGIRCIAC